MTTTNNNPSRSNTGGSGSSSSRFLDDENDVQEEEPQQKQAHDRRGDGSHDDDHDENVIAVLLPLTRSSASSSSSSLANEEERELVDFRLHVEMTAFLAFRHLMTSNGSVLEHLPDRLATCNDSFQKQNLKYRHHDTQFSPLHAAQELLSYFNDNEQQQPPFAILGAAWSSVSQVVSILGSAFEIPQISSSSTASSLTNSPYFARTVPTSGADAHAVIYYLYFSKIQHVGVMYVDDPWGRRWLEDLQRYAKRYEISLHTFGYTKDLEYISSEGAAQIDSVIQQMQQSQINYFVGIWATWKPVVRALYKQNLMGPPSSTTSSSDSSDSSGTTTTTTTKVWIIPDFIEATSTQFTLDAITEYDIANALHGTAIVNLQLKSNSKLDDALQEMVISFREEATTATSVMSQANNTHRAATNTTTTSLFQEYLHSHSSPEMLQNYFSSPSPPQMPSPSLYQYLTYDAMIALGITACEVLSESSISGNELDNEEAGGGLHRRGKEFYNKLLEINFEGVSGQVQFDNQTGNRLGATLSYPIVNMVLQQQPQPQQQQGTSNNNSSSSSGTTTATSLSFETQVVATVELLGEEPTIIHETTNQQQPLLFVYADNTMIAPPGLPPLGGQDFHLIPTSILGIGLGLAALVMSISIGNAIWVFCNKHLYTIRASQPIFLIQLCLGTFIVATTIIPLGWQESSMSELLESPSGGGGEEQQQQQQQQQQSTAGLDAACQSIPWLLFVGFSVAMSALWSKASRINQLLNSGASFRRITVSPQDVMKSTVILLMINVVLLTAWTLSPWRLRWHRIPIKNNVDPFGRIVESYGACRSSDGEQQSQQQHYGLFFSIPLAVTNATALFMATFQSYRARNLPDELSEPGYLSTSLISLCETFSLGIPIVFVVQNQPTAFYLTSSIIISVACLAILLPVFLPKYLLHRKIKAPTSNKASSMNLLSSTHLGSGSNHHHSSHQLHQSSTLSTTHPPPPPPQQQQQQKRKRFLKSSSGSNSSHLQPSSSKKKSTSNNDSSEMSALRLELKAIKENMIRSGELICNAPSAPSSNNDYNSIHENG